MSQNLDLKFPQKIYLSGADCFHLMLEINSKKHISSNNVIRIIFHFDDEASVNPIINNIKLSPLITWLCNISLVKGVLFQKPYWKYKNTGNKIAIKNHFCDTDKFIPSEILNRKINIHSDCPIEFDVIKYSSKKVALIISWHHIIMDGRGSGMLMQHLNNQTPVTNKLFSEFFPNNKTKTSLFRYIKNMYEVKAFIEKSSKAPIATVSKGNISSNAAFKTKTILFNKLETEKIDSNSKKNGARFGSNIFLMSCCAHIVHEINLLRQSPGTIWIPIPQDGRKRGGFGPIISNCISFLFYRLTVSDLTSVKQTVQSINHQLAEQIKLEMPKKYNMLLNMMRHIPLKLYHFLSTNASKGVVASFLYSSAGEDFRDLNSLTNKPANDVLILPPSTFPPGLTFSFLRFNGNLKMNIVYCQDTISTKELDLIGLNIKKYILGDY